MMDALTLQVLAANDPERGAIMCRPGYTYNERIHIGCFATSYYRDKPQYVSEMLVINGLIPKCYFCGRHVRWTS